MEHLTEIELRNAIAALRLTVFSERSRVMMGGLMFKKAKKEKVDNQDKLFN